MRVTKESRRRAGLLDRDRERRALITRNYIMLFFLLFLSFSAGFFSPLRDGTRKWLVDIRRV